MLVMSLLLVSSAFALDNSNFDWNVEVDGTEVLAGDNTVNDKKTGDDVLLGNTVIPSVSVDEGKEIDVKVTLVAKQAVQDIEVEARIKGYDHGTLSDSTDLFNMAANTQKTKHLKIQLPTKLDKKEYWLHLTIDSAASKTVKRIVKLNVEPSKHGVDIADVSLSPGTTVKAGRSLLTTVLLENFGDRHEKDVKVTVSVPALGVSASEIVDVLKMDDKNGYNNVDFEDVPEMFVPIPAAAKPGEYEVVVTAKYDYLQKTVSKKFKINVVENELFPTEEKLVLAVGPDNAAVSAGKTTKFMVGLANQGKSAKAYTLQVSTGDWATAALSETLVVLEAGKTKTVAVDLSTAKDAALGEHTASLTVKSGSELLQTVPLKATVSKATTSSSDGSNLRNGLEVALIVLVVLLVIVFLIIGFSRLKKDDEEEQTYY